MRDNLVKRKLAAGGSVIGTMILEFATTGIARIAAAAGAEFILHDLEHTGWSMETIRSLLATARGADIVPLVRVPATEYHFIARVLDLGAMGVMVPMVESADQARRIVQSAKYPPAGRRGCAFGVSHDDYRAGPIADSMQSANRETLLIAQIETAAGLEHCDAIAATDGIDVLWIGHNDLTASLGIAGQLDHPRYHEAIQHVADTAKKHGKSAGFLVTQVAAGQHVQKLGYRMLAYGGDVWLFQATLRDGIAALKV